MAESKHKDEITGVETTGHEWDGIRELNNPLPRWWLYVFYASVIWAVGYWIAHGTNGVEATSAAPMTRTHHE